MVRQEFMINPKIQGSAVIPCWNDGYTLAFCLESIAGVIDEVVVVDDASEDDSAEVAARAAEKFGNIRILRTPRVGNIEARNAGMVAARHDRMVFIDADDVFCGNVAELRRAVAGFRHFGLINLYGDLHHREIPPGPVRGLHYDVCHLAADRRWGFSWFARPDALACAGNLTVNKPWPQSNLLFWHLRGVKPDWRLLDRQRRWWEAARHGFNRPAPTDIVAHLAGKNLEWIGQSHPWYPPMLKGRDRFLIRRDTHGCITGRTDTLAQR